MNNLKGGIASMGMDIISSKAEEIAKAIREYEKENWRNDTLYYKLRFVVEPLEIMATLTEYEEYSVFDRRYQNKKVCISDGWTLNFAQYGPRNTRIKIYVSRPEGFWKISKTPEEPISSIPFLMETVCKQLQTAVYGE